jgi:hypothetical protein
MHGLAPESGCNNLLKMGNLGVEMDVVRGNVSS